MTQEQSTYKFQTKLGAIMPVMGAGYGKIWKECPSCSGGGEEEDGAGPKACHECGGRGEVPVDDDSDLNILPGKIQAPVQSRDDLVIVASEEAEVISFYKASPITRNEPVAGVVIRICYELPEVDCRSAMTLAEVGEFYDQQARVLAKVLMENLPQGTSDRLIMELMAKKVSLYRGIDDGRRR